MNGLGRIGRNAVNVARIVSIQDYAELSEDPEEADRVVFRLDCGNGVELVFRKESAAEARRFVAALPEAASEVEAVPERGSVVVGPQKTFTVEGSVEGTIRTENGG